MRLRALEEDVLVAGRQGEGRIIFPQGLVKSACASQGKAPVGMRPRRPGRQADGLGQFRQRFGRLPRHRQRQPEFGPRVRIAWLHRHRLAVSRDGMRKVAPVCLLAGRALKDGREVFLRVAVVRLEPEGRPKLLQGLVDLSKRREDRRQVVVRLRKPLVEG